MKSLICIFTVIPFVVFGQSNLVLLDTRYHVDFWKPYSREVKEYQDSTNALRSQTYSAGLSTEVRLSKKWWVLLGFSYKSIDYRVVDQIHKWNYVHTSAGQGAIYQDTLTRIYNDPADLVAKSNNWGIKLETNYQLNEAEKLQTSVGLSSEFYFLERYFSEYQSNDHSPYDYPESIPYPLIDNEGKFFFSSINLNCHYRIRWLFSQRFNAGLKLSVGTNLYSNWTHFSRNAWIGLNLELGFGRKP